MNSILAIELPEKAYSSLRKMAERQRRKPEEVAAEMLTTTIQQAVEDPLLQLSGVFSGNLTDVGERHDEYLGQNLMRELRGDQDG